MTPQHGLGRRPAVDPRDQHYSMKALALPLVHAKKRYDRVFYNTGPQVLDQGGTSQCVAYAWSLFLQAFPVYANQALITPSRYYDLAQTLDEFDDTPPADGTSVRAGAKALQQLGHIKNYVWTSDVQDIITWMQAGAGTVVVGTDWTNSMFNPDAHGRIVVDRASGLAGGHAWLLCGYDPVHIFGNSVMPAFRMQNSWGRGWGENGRAWISQTDLTDLIDNGGEVACGVETLADAKG